MMVVPVMAIGKMKMSMAELVMVEEFILVEATMEGVRGVNREILNKARAEIILLRKDRLGRADGPSTPPDGSRLAFETVALSGRKPFSYYRRLEARRRRTSFTFTMVHVMEIEARCLNRTQRLL